MSTTYPKIMYTGTQAAYDAIESKDSSILYWTSDTNKIYKGSVDFSKYCEAVASRPAAPAAGRLYLCADTGKAEFYTGSEWKTLNLPEATSFTDETADNNHVPTTSAVKAYVAAMIGSSADVVKSVVNKASKAGTITVTQADGSSADVTVSDVVVGIADGASAAQIKITDTDGDETDYTIKGVGTGLGAGASAAQVTLSKSSGTADTVTVPGVLTGLAAGSAAAGVSITKSDGTDSITVPGVVTGLAAGSTDGAVAVTLSSGTHADVTVPGVFNAVSFNAQTRQLTFTDTSGVSTGEDHVVDLGKDIFIDPDGNNRYENGNIYLYLNDGTGTKDPTELVIPVTGLITDYIGDDTATIDVTVDSSTHKVSADVKVRPDDAEASFVNALQVSEEEDAEGLYVDLAPLTERVDALQAAITWGTF